MRHAQAPNSDLLNDPKHLCGTYSDSNPRSFLVNVCRIIRPFREKQNVQCCQNGRTLGKSGSLEVSHGLPTEQNLVKNPNYLEAYIWPFTQLAGGSEPWAIFVTVVQWSERTLNREGRVQRSARQIRCPDGDERLTAKRNGICGIGGREDGSSFHLFFFGRNIGQHFATVGSILLHLWAITFSVAGTYYSYPFQHSLMLEVGIAPKVSCCPCRGRHAQYSHTRTTSDCGILRRPVRVGVRRRQHSHRP